MVYRRVLEDKSVYLCVSLCVCHHVLEEKGKEREKEAMGNVPLG